eukprot:m.62597 g.62597  ORF g.62597 m.62597 type:complete len:121 (+) comp11917_c0_seq1:1083-1445(+)
MASKSTRYFCCSSSDSGRLLQKSCVDLDKTTNYNTAPILRRNMPRTMHIPPSITVVVRKVLLLLSRLPLIARETGCHLPVLLCLAEHVDQRLGSSTILLLALISPLEFVCFSVLGQAVLA